MIASAFVIMKCIPLLLPFSVEVYRNAHSDKGGKSSFFPRITSMRFVRSIFPLPIIFFLCYFLPVKSQRVQVEDSILHLQILLLPTLVSPKQGPALRGLTFCSVLFPTGLCPRRPAPPGTDSEPRQCIPAVQPIPQRKGDSQDFLSDSRYRGPSRNHLLNNPLSDTVGLRYFHPPHLLLQSPTTDAVCEL